MLSHLCSACAYSTCLACSVQFSHLYQTDGAFVGGFQRIDIPILRNFDQYTYILFTGAFRFDSPRDVWLECSCRPWAVPHLYDACMEGSMRNVRNLRFPLHTDCDVYFRQHMKLVDWGTPLPTALGLG